jgi:DNA-binding transcriptional LysR family regulator
MEFDFRQLEVFCRIVELKSFSKAATAVHLAQASVSERMSTLEQQVGCRLLDRLGRTTVPTAAGKTFYVHAVDLLKRRDQSILEMRNLVGLRCGSVRIGCSSVPGEDILPPVLARFQKEEPEVVPHVVVADTDDVVRLVESGEVELGFVGAPTVSGNLESERLWSDELVVVVPPGHRWAGRKSLSAGDLASEPMVRREGGSGTRRLLEERWEKAGIRSELRVAAVLGSLNAVRHAVRCGLGIAVMSSRSVETDVRTGLLVALKIRNLKLKRDIFLVCDSRRELSPIARLFRDFVRKEVG